MKWDQLATRALQAPRGELDSQARRVKREFQGRLVLLAHRAEEVPRDLQGRLVKSVALAPLVVQDSEGRLVALANEDLMAPLAPQEMPAQATRGRGGLLVQRVRTHNRLAPLAPWARLVALVLLAHREGLVQRVQQVQTDRW